MRTKYAIKTFLFVISLLFSLLPYSYFHRSYKQWRLCCYCSRRVTDLYIIVFSVYSEVVREEITNKITEHVQRNITTMNGFLLTQEQGHLF